VSTLKSTNSMPAGTQDRIATGLMLLSAFAAVYSFVTGISAALAADSTTQQVEWWRVLGFAMFAGFFVLLAFWPRRYPGLWELVIVDKAALTVVELLLIQNNAANASAAAVADGILTVILIAAYLLSKGYTSWRTRR